MKTKKFTQYGIFQIIAFGILLILFSIKAYNLGFNDKFGIIYGLLSLTMFVCLLFIYKIVIEINENMISFKLGIGLFKRSYLIDNIFRCNSVRSSLFDGLGIRKIHNGWLYNVAGLKVIELNFKDSKRIIQIGTNKPDEIALIINNLVNQDKIQIESTSIRNKPSKNGNKLLAISISLLIVILFNLYQSKSARINLYKDNFEILGSFGESINYEDIRKIDTISVMPKIGTRTNGFCLLSIAKGYFDLQGIGNAYLNLNLKYPPYIRIILKDNEYHFFNLSNAEETKKIFKRLEKAKE